MSSWRFESEAFRVLRGSAVDAQRASMGDLWGILTRAICELAAREENTALAGRLNRTV